MLKATRIEVMLVNDDVGKYFGAVDATAESEDEGEACAKDRAAEGDGYEVLGIEDEGNVFEEFKAYCVDGGSYECSYGELRSKKIEACDYKWDEDSEYAG